MVGNVFEVKEVIDMLKGEGFEDLIEFCLILGSYMVVFVEKVSSLDEVCVMF